MTTMPKFRTTFAAAALGILVAATTASATFTAVGPVNRETPFAPEGAPFIKPAQFDPAYPLGYPLWYQDSTGLRLTITFPPEGISEAGPPPLNTGGETFYWTASAAIPGWTPNPADPNVGLNAAIEFAMEGTFGGDESIVDGQQITFTRLRIRIDTPVVGTYTVTHPYGTQDIVVDVAAGGINITSDIGGAPNPFDPNPDSEFNGALAHPVVGPNFLTWNTFNLNPALNDPALQVTNPATPARPFQFVGMAGVDHAITPGPNGVNFTVTGPGGLTNTTNLWDVTGKVFTEPVPIVPTGNQTVVPANSLLLD